MDAVEFLRERRRMCNAQDDCDTCPIDIVCADYFVNHNYSQEKASGMVSTVEQWAAEHPAKTRQSEFLKLFPGADVGKTDGCLTLCPCNIYEKMRKECGGPKCSECRRKFWLAEVEE